MAEKSASSAKRESTSIPGEAIVASASAAMPQTDAESVPAANVGPAPDPAASEARSLRGRQILAYRNGDLNGAIADLDKAIQFDPKFLAAPIKFDRGFYRAKDETRGFR